MSLEAFPTQFLYFLFERAGFGIRRFCRKLGFSEGVFGFFGGPPRLLGFAFGPLEPDFGFAGFDLGEASGLARLSGFLFKTPCLFTGGSSGLFYCFEFHGFYLSRLWRL